MKKYEKLIFEVSKKGRKAYTLPKNDVEEKELTELVPQGMLREKLNLPEVTEVDTVRHFTNLSTKNYGVDTGFYPLGSCTMKYNPKINEDMAALKGFTDLHPLQNPLTTQGALALMHDMEGMLGEVAGMDGFTLQPAAGAHGELTGLMIIKAYHENKKDFKRTKIIVPDSAHGTNPATAQLCGFDIVEIKSNEDGSVSLEELRSVLSDEIAGLMLTNPSTLGLFESNIKEIADLVHDAGGLLYYDGANMNAIMGISRPGDMGFDVIHFNIHKTFSTPHGGGGPGSGPVGVKKDLIPFLPVPIIQYDEALELYKLDYSKPLSIGKVKSFYGNFQVIVKAYTYIKMMGRNGLKKASEIAVLNANYIKEELKDTYYLPIDKVCMHEFVFSGIKDNHEVSTLDIAKRLLDYGYHPPTVYFPLIIKEAIMIEPTETESKEEMDGFIEAMRKIAIEAKENPEILKSAPHTTVVGRIDEVKAARDLILKYKPE